MTHHDLTRADVEAGFFDGALARILDLQRTDGAIPWYDNGVIDPWNHVEAAMGLAVLGAHDAARKAFAFLAKTQLEDGSWWSQYGAAVPLDDGGYTGDGDREKRIRDTNFCAYAATGVRHFHLVTGDAAFLARYWPMVERGIDFVLTLQSEHGDIRWAAPDDATPENDALITGCSSIHKSLLCGYHLSCAAGHPREDWLRARAALGEALRHKPHRFDRQWDKKDNFSMDWFYPVLGGVLTGAEGRARIASRWDAFVSDGRGCRCVLEQPWVTVAETAELVLALLACGMEARAREVYSWVHQWRAEDGAYWMGYQFEHNVPWPDEKPAWTAGAVILAADALLGLTDANALFTDNSVSQAFEQA